MLRGHSPPESIAGEYTFSVFPTTIWTTIHQAGEQDTVALEDVAQRYRQPVFEYIRRRGFNGNDAEDICQDVFVRVLQGGVLAKADRQRGRFRSLLLSVTTHVILDRLRKRRETPVEDLETESRESEPPRASTSSSTTPRTWQDSLAPASGTCSTTTSSRAVCT